MKHTLVAAFPTLTDANRTQGDLMSRGIAREQIHSVGADSADIHAYDEPYSTTSSTVDRPHHDSKIANFFSSLFGHEPHERHRHHAKAYPEAVRRGALVIAVDVYDDDQLAKARDALEYNGAISVNEQGVGAGHTGGSGGYSGPSSPYAGATGGDSHLDKQFVGSPAAVAGHGDTSHHSTSGSTATTAGTSHAGETPSTTRADTRTADTGRYDVGGSAKRAGTDYPTTTATANPTGGGITGLGGGVGTHHATESVGAREEPCSDRICMIQRSS